MSATIYIGRECFHVEGPEHFANILEEKLGRDAAEYFRAYKANHDPNECAGECDRIYDLQHDYECAIDEALEMLAVVEPKNSSKVHLEDAKIILRGARYGV